MMIKLLEDWTHPCGEVYHKGAILNMHPIDGGMLVSEKIGKEDKPGIIRKIKNKIDGDNREN